MREAVKIALGGTEFSLRPTWSAYGEIESRCGPLNTLWRNLSIGNVTLQHMTVIVAAGIKAAGGSPDGRPVSEDAVSKRLFEQGPWSDEVRVPILEYIEALGWTPEQRKKIQAETERHQKEMMPDLSAGFSL